LARRKLLYIRAAASSTAADSATTRRILRLRAGSIATSLGACASSAAEQSVPKDETIRARRRLLSERPLMRPRLQRVTKRRPAKPDRRRGHIAPARPAPPETPFEPEDRLREAGGPEDQATYTC